MVGERQKELGRLWRQPGGPSRQLGGFQRQQGMLLRQLGDVLGVFSWGGSESILGETSLIIG